jgi:CubicO group peptidase (beta-lactamase class C family)
VTRPAETTPRGTVAPGYERVQDAFSAMLADYGDGGCAFAAVVGGAPVVHLWAGLADERTERPWAADTAAVLFSGTKGVVAVALAVLADRGGLDLGRRVAELWPEFAAGGKDGITVAQLAAHCAGLPALERPLTIDDLHRPQELADWLASQSPMVPIGRPSYHAVTWGWLAGELVRRVDGRTVGTFVAEELAGPLGLDLRIGVPAGDAIVRRLAHVRQAPGYRLSAYAADEPDPRLAAVYPLAGLGADPWNDPRLLSAELPSAGGVATAMAMARLYGALVASAGPLVSTATIARATEPEGAGDDPITGFPLRFGPTGFELAGTTSELGPARDAFGHTGAGGSSHGAWPSLRTGFSFLTAEMRTRGEDDRAAWLLAALHETVPAG